MDFIPAPPMTAEETYTLFSLPEEQLRPVAPLDALRADAGTKRRSGVRGFGDWRFWIALACYGTSLPLFFADALSWRSFQILMPVLIAFIIVATLAWDFRLIGDPNRTHCLILHTLFLVAVVFLLNRLMTMEDFVPDPEEAGFLAGLWNAGVELLTAVPMLDSVVRLGGFLLKWAGYAVILFLVSGAVIFPQRIANALLFVFGLIFIAVSVGQNLNPALWSLGLGLLLLTVAYVLQLADDRESRFWAKAAERFARSPRQPGVTMDIKLDILRLLRAERSVGRERFRGVVAARLGTRSDDPRVNQVCVQIADQLSAQDGLAESRDGGEGWRFVLAGGDEAADFFAFTARTVRVVLTLGFSVVYILSPIDLLPDATPVFGVVDDMLLGTVGLLSTLRTYFTYR